MENLDTLLYWVKERENIRVQQAAGAPFPWTKDKVLQENRFCNVRREDDRVTVWVNSHIRQPYADHPYLWFMLCITRLINWPNALQELMSPLYVGAWPLSDKFKIQDLEDALADRASMKMKVWTGAYLVPSGPVKGGKRHTYVCQSILKPLWEAREDVKRLVVPGCSIKDAHTYLTSFNGWGQFLAYQVCVDLRFTRYLQNAPDRESWAAAGPGTLRGLNRVFGRHFSARLTQPQAREEMRKLYEVVPSRTGVAMDFSDVPNILCETDKYIRIIKGEGKMKAKYVPGRGY